MLPWRRSHFSYLITPRFSPACSHKDALAHDDAEAWLAAERKELRNHTVHKTFEQLDRSSMLTDAQTRSRLIPLQWVYKTKRDGSKKARLVVVGCAQRPGV